MPKTLFRCHLKSNSPQLNFDGERGSCALIRNLAAGDIQSFGSPGFRCARQIAEGMAGKTARK